MRNGGSRRQETSASCYQGNHTGYAGKGRCEAARKDNQLSLTQPVRPYLIILRVTRMDEEVLVEKEAIPYQVVTKNNQMDEGVQQGSTEGRQGELERRVWLPIKTEWKLIADW